MNTDERRYDEADDSDLNGISFRINGCAMTVLNAIGHGFQEKVYENALALEFEHCGLKFSQQQPFEISFRDTKVGVFVPDFVVEDRVIVELKAVDCLGANEKGQALNYLRASGLSLAILLNFKNARLEWQRVIL